ncbi:carbohydrate kinase family protein [Micromonospora sp. WMMD1082]|uniref:carbohydrate kinase family protein n=1 Tax=Micromonospora sp. WMMD1082 TaxID=3016104 RepID=UPI00241660B1|nr:carbohydrate kinase family protein [Micromonospora sp. WMMD1082]MDG4796290.1 carbohydrate kinase family protein [Micromonospora sp. WMMD1082]
MASLAVHLAVDGFPVRYAPVSTPAWIDAGLGGAGAQIAAILRHLGDDVDLCSIVGTDGAGELVRAQLRAVGLDGPGVIEGTGSSQTVVLVAPDGKRMVYPHLAVVNAVGYPESRFAQALAGADLAVLTNAGFVRELLPAAVLKGVPVAVDVNVIADINEVYHQPWLDVADIIFCSGERLPCPAPTWIAQVLTRHPGAAMAAVGCGPRGSVLGLRDGRLVTAAAVAPLGVRNTSSAGDSLFAAFLHSWLATGNPVEALSDAVVFAGWRVGHRQPTSVLLSGRELAQLRLRHPVRISVGWWDQGG